MSDVSSLIAQVLQQAEQVGYTLQTQREQEKQRRELEKQRREQQEALHCSPDPSDIDRRSLPGNRQRGTLTSSVSARPARPARPPKSASPIRQLERENRAIRLRIEQASAHLAVKQQLVRPATMARETGRASSASQSAVSDATDAVESARQVAALRGDLERVREETAVLRRAQASLEARLAEPRAG